MLQKSLVTGSDVIIYDLEDSVAPSEVDKNDARERLTEFLTARLLHEIDCCKLIARTENGGR
jgi:citrate lyase beta subunit